MSYLSFISILACRPLIYYKKIKEGSRYIICHFHMQGFSTVSLRLFQFISISGCFITSSPVMLFDRQGNLHTMNGNSERNKAASIYQFQALRQFKKI